MTYSLEAGAPSGMVINATTGRISWPPSDGPYSTLVKVWVRDDATQSLADSKTFRVTVRNVAPTLGVGGDELVAQGGMFSRVGSFADPGSDTWTLTVDHGDGTGIQPLVPGPDKTFRLQHVYRTAGKFTTTVVVTDKDGGRAARSFVVTSRDLTPPSVVGFVAAPKGAYLANIAITLSEPVESTAARLRGTYRIVSAGRDGRFGTRDDASVSLRPVSYSASARTVTLTPLTRVSLSQRLRLTIPSTARLRDLAGNILDGDGNGKAGGDFSRDFGGISFAASPRSRSAVVHPSGSAARRNSAN